MSDNRFTEKKKQATNPLIDARVKSLQGEKPYMLESAGMVGEVNIVNDSAATSLTHVAESLLTFDSPVIWIADTRANTQDFRMISELLGTHVKAMVATGDFTDEVHNSLWNELGYFVSAQSWEEALDMSLLLAKPGDTVLFSPGCRAGEPFENFSERGAYFSRLVDIKRESK